ncbi:MAG: peptidoglycan editing factor PgeF [Bacteroidetes bacterium]|nr:peptidoglycan editing factor PgeF [Bacteroidota bacterium]MCL5027017.1 peptidoglycan editing factor PgeF [Chloroflexota bacterium]
MIQTSLDELLLYRFENLAAWPGLAHGVASRVGGASGGTYAGLNISFGTGDDPALVTANRRALYQSLGAAPEQVAVARQVHSRRVLVVSSSDGLEPSDGGWRTMPQEGDGLITDEPGLYLQMSFGDCVPLLFFDPVRRAVGIAHSGWKGTVAKIGAATLEAMAAAFGSRPGDILAGIGPSIGPCCYQVREDVAGPARRAFPGVDGLLVPQPDGSVHLDLWAACRQALLEGGVRPEHVETSGVCTRCHREHFFSARGGDRGRFAAIIGLPMP